MRQGCFVREEKGGGRGPEAVRRKTEILRLWRSREDTHLSVSKSGSDRSTPVSVRRGWWRRGGPGTSRRPRFERSEKVVGGG